MLTPAQPTLDLFRTPLKDRSATSFRRNQLKNLARRKGYRIQRVYQRHIGWTYVINLLPYPGSRERVIRQYEYCKTQFATAAERAYMHLSSKPDISFRRQKKVLLGA